MDLSKLNEQELDKLRKQIEREKEARQEKARTDVTKRIEKIASDAGFTVEELFGKQRGRRTSKKTIRFRHPDDSSKTWAGRGRRPQWVEDFLGEGRSLDEARV